VVVVDTSVWISAHRRPSGQVAVRLNRLLEADEVALALPVRFELVAGVARRDRAALTRALAGLPVLRPTDETWALVERWIITAADKGHRFGLSDLLIAALTHEIGGLVWSEDEDFEALEKLKVVQRYDW
jgi:predicted nucleic acid-binding protein